MPWDNCFDFLSFSHGRPAGLTRTSRTSRYGIQLQSNWILSGIEELPDSHDGASLHTTSVAQKQAHLVFCVRFSQIIPDPYLNLLAVTGHAYGTGSASLSRNNSCSLLIFTLNGKQKRAIVLRTLHVFKQRRKQGGVTCTDLSGGRSSLLIRDQKAQTEF